MKKLKKGCRNWVLILDEFQISVEEVEMEDEVVEFKNEL